MLNEEKKNTFKMVGNFLAFLLALALCPLGHMVTKSKRRSIPVSNSLTQTRGSREYLICNVQPCVIVV